MRVNPNPYPDLVAAAEATQQQINTDEEQISSGQAVNVPSDNPAAAAILVQNAAQTSQADQFERSIGSIQGEIQNADTALNSVTTALQQAITLGTEGANGTVNAADRQAIATQVEGIQNQLVSLANLSYQGNYVFAGTATQTSPYVLDASSPSGVTYQGNSGVNSVTLGNQFSLQTNLPGSQIFSAPGNDMFQSIQDLINGLISGNGIGTAVNEVDTAMNYVDAQRVFYGNALNQLNGQQNYLSTETTQLAQQQNTVGGADLTVVISNLTTSQTSLQATLQAIADTANTNLFEYLR
ncbi:MAG: flagellar hook-associated protein FlgL [Candidatus Sulfotelmatobacter sp.]|jgi:flagellar hook-associated protein 3 FlgL